MTEERDPYAPPTAPAYRPPVAPPPAYPPPAPGWGPAQPPPAWGAPPAYAPYSRPPRRGPRLTLPWVTLFVVLAVLVVDVVVLAGRTGGSALPRSVAVEKRLVTESARDAQRRAERRDAAIDALFARRAKAVRDGDRAAFLADLDPEQAAFRARQEEVFASLGKLDFAHWSYERMDESYSPGSIDYARYGRISDLWLPVLILRYRLAGFDVAPVGRRIVYTVVQRGPRWYIGGDTDLEDITSSGTSVRVDPWENGPILVQRSKHGIVIGHAEDAAAIGAIRKSVENAVAHVTRYVGTKKWNRKVVVVLPTNEDELNRILENPTTFYDFAAVARPLATIPRGDEDEEYAGSRVVINPDGFDPDSDFTTHLIRHEITHVALFERIGPLSPKWLIEGVAEYVGNAESDLPPEVLAAELTKLVADSGVPTTLPTDSDFGLIADAGVAYNTAWLLCRYIASRYGRDKLFALHDVMGTRTGLAKPGEKYPAALRSVLGTTEPELLAGWRPYVRATVGDLAKVILTPEGGYRALERGRLDVEDVAEQKGMRAADLAKAGAERAAAAYFVRGPESAPSRRLITTLVTSATHSGAAEVERRLTARLRPYDPSGRAIAHGRIYFVGTTIGGRHYNETIAVVRAGTVVVEIRVAVPGTGDSSVETTRVAAAQHAAVARP